MTTSTQLCETASFYQAKLVLEGKVKTSSQKLLVILVQEFFVRRCSRFSTFWTEGTSGTPFIGSQRLYILWRQLWNRAHYIKEHPAKTKCRTVLLKMFTTGGPKCPVQFFTQYLELWVKGCHLHLPSEEHRYSVIDKHLKTQWSKTEQPSQAICHPKEVA